MRNTSRPVVPSFITEGELVVVTTEDGNYLKRAAKEGK